MAGEMDGFMAGYLDGGDLNNPEPNANRSHAYRHSFAVRRREVLKQSPIPAAQAREMAREAEQKDASA